jgi:hypothetical protein
MFETLGAMKSQAISKTVYDGYTYVHTLIIKIYEYLLVIGFVPIFLFEGVLMYVYLERHGVSFMKAMYTSFFANIASIFSALLLFLVEHMMNELHFSSTFTAVYLVLISFILTTMVETAVIYRFIRDDLKKDALNKAAIISGCVNLASHIAVAAFLSFI